MTTELIEVVVMVDLERACGVLRTIVMQAEELFTAKGSTLTLVEAATQAYGAQFSLPDGATVPEAQQADNEQLAALLPAAAVEFGMKFASDDDPGLRWEGGTAPAGVYRGWVGCLRAPMAWLVADYLVASSTHLEDINNQRLGVSG